MENPVVASYQNYREEDRLTTNNARRIEFITTARVIDQWLPPHQDILDCAAGAGIYAFHLAERGHQVTATDLTPRHIQLIDRTLEGKTYHMHTAVLDATDLSVFEDETFDVVLNMGPMYHLPDERQRKQCLAESLRVLRKGGLLLCSYIPRYFVFQHVAMIDSNLLDPKLARQLIKTGALRHDDENCFWTDTYYAGTEEMEQLFSHYGLEIVDHFAQDGLAPSFAKTVDNWSEEQFKVWCEYHYSICRERSILGATNHAMIIGRKV